MFIKLTEIECAANRAMTGIDELAANVSQIGLINPITLVENPQGSAQSFRFSRLVR